MSSLQGLVRNFKLTEGNSNPWNLHLRMNAHDWELKCNKFFNWCRIKNY